MLEGSPYCGATDIVLWTRGTSDFFCGGKRLATAGGSSSAGKLPEGTQEETVATSGFVFIGYQFSNLLDQLT